MRRKGLLALATCVGLLLLAAPAQGAFHLMKIREISGSTAGTNTAYIELQMYEAGQNQVSGHNITFWDPDALILGVPTPTATLPLSGPNPPNAESQRTILIGDSGVAGRDFTLELTPYMETGGGGDIAAGALCFENVDCVSWGGGAFTGAANLPDPTTPFGNPLPTTFALNRTIARGCATALDPADDTNDAAADFSGTAEAPRNNATAPTEALCLVAGPTDATGPAQTLTAKKLQDVDKAAVFERLSEAGTVTLRGKVKVPNTARASGLRPLTVAARAIKTKKATRLLAANTKTKIRIRLSKSAKKKVKAAIEDAGPRKIVVTAVARDALGNKTTKRVRFKLKD